MRLRFLPDGRIGLLVLDDGVGFDTAILDGVPSESNFGVYGMIERTELIGGRLWIRSRPGEGVAVRAVAGAAPTQPAVHHPRSSSVD